MRKGIILGAVFAALLSGCTEPLKPDAVTTKGIAAATGGVLGAGLGAIVGNQVGDTGSGLVIGSLAGAGAGYAIGSVLQTQEEAIQQQDEALERQQRTIQAQNEELRELRRGSGEPVALTSGSSTTANTTSSYKGNSEKAGYRWSSSREEALARSRQEAAARSKGSVATSSSYGRASQPSTVSQPNTSHSSSAVQNKAAQKTFVSPPQESLQKEPAQNVGLEPSVERRLQQAETAREVPPASEGLTEKTISEVSSDESSDIVGFDGAEEDSATGTEAALASGVSDECRQAAEEKSRADSETESSQQLFHLRRALRLCPDAPEFHVALGKAYVRMERSEDAAFEFQEALRLNPNYAPALKALQDVNASMQSEKGR